jgi:hypothetical protein
MVWGRGTEWFYFSKLILLYCATEAVPQKGIQLLQRKSWTQLLFASHNGLSRGLLGTASLCYILKILLNSRIVNRRIVSRRWLEKTPSHFQLRVTNWGTSSGSSPSWQVI